MEGKYQRLTKIKRDGRLYRVLVISSQFRLQGYPFPWPLIKSTLNSVPPKGATMPVILSYKVDLPPQLHPYHSIHRPPPS